MQQKMRNGEHTWIARIDSSIALQCAEIISIAEFSAQLFEDDPIALLPLVSNFSFKLAFEIGCDPIVVEQSVVDVEKKNQFLVHHLTQLRELSYRYILPNDRKYLYRVSL